MGETDSYNLFCCCGSKNPLEFLKGACVALLVMSIFFILLTAGTILALWNYAIAAAGTYVFVVFDLVIIIYSSVTLSRIKTDKWEDVSCFVTTVFVLSIIRLVLLLISFIVTLLWLVLLTMLADGAAEIAGYLLAVIFVMYGISIFTSSWAISMCKDMKKAVKKQKKAAKQQDFGPSDQVVQMNQYTSN